MGDKVCDFLFHSPYCKPFKERKLLPMGQILSFSSRSQQQYFERVASFVLESIPLNYVCRIFLHKKVRYEVLWHINLINGFRISLPSLLFGAMRYSIHRTGNMKPMVRVIRSLQTILRRRNPGEPSYHSVAKSCWQFGWATN